MMLNVELNSQRIRDDLDDLSQIPPHNALQVETHRKSSNTDTAQLTHTGSQILFDVHSSTSNLKMTQIYFINL